LLVAQPTSSSLRTPNSLYSTRIQRSASALLDVSLATLAVPGIWLQNELFVVDDIWLKAAELTVNAGVAVGTGALAWVTWELTQKTNRRPRTL
jgi:hypothetical protein